MGRLVQEERPRVGEGMSGVVDVVDDLEEHTEEEAREWDSPYECINRGWMERKNDPIFDKIAAKCDRKN